MITTARVLDFEPPSLSPISQAEHSSFMTLFGRERHPLEVPEDSPDLSYVMSFVTSMGGLSAYWTRRSSLGLLSGVGVGAAFALGGYWIQTANPEKHEFAHQICLIASVLFGGAMGYRAGSNPYVGPGGAMLASLGGVSSAYHLKKFLEWRSYEQSRIHEAERLLRDYQFKHPDTTPQLAPNQLAGGPFGEAGRGRGPPQGHPYPNPHHPGPYEGRGPRPQLDRRSPIPPGGF